MTAAEGTTSDGPPSPTAGTGTSSVPPGGAAASPSPITRGDVAHVAVLARLELTEDELDRFTGQLARVLDHAADVAALDLSGVAPTAHPLPVSNVLRPDEPRPSLDRQEVLDAAPSVETGQFRVPRIVGEPA